ncbi:Regulatory protein RecX [Polaribacter huanghezhanensis]|uniref:regulatory protein RecX n=1 Tax=Polaribacter huanghezhanensis TaxID=1354726 RepID=UPI002647A301|nr:regulatory protein RecX [Polaribacter huanghezhanensis]WKD85687.1 Regulatory protein RecX [Polaribacter huanghezhanensis]
MNEQKYFSIEEIKRKLERYCVYQDRCHKEIETKLREFILIEEAKNQIILHLMEHDFLNEERFSKSFARGKFKIKNWGKQRIIRELKSRDISEYNIKTALKEIDEEEYLATINKIAVKRNSILNESDFYKRKKKLTDYLIRKGYEFDLIFSTIKRVLEKNNF